MDEDLEVAKDIQPTTRKFLHDKVWNDMFKVYDIICVDEFCDKNKTYHAHIERERHFV